jgi:hypothetical protein
MLSYLLITVLAALYAGTVVAAVQMKRLRRYRQALAGSLVAICSFPGLYLFAYGILGSTDVAVSIPLFALPCLPLGVWSLVVLRNPEVRSAFLYPDQRPPETVRRNDPPVGQ